MLRKHHCTPPILNRIQKTPSTLLDNPTHFKTPRKHPGEELETRLQNPTRRNEDPVKIYYTHLRKTENPERPNFARTYLSKIRSDNRDASPLTCPTRQTPMQQRRNVSVFLLNPLPLPLNADAYAETTLRFCLSVKSPETDHDADVHAETTMGFCSSTKPTGTAP